jgi:hypothetical protein
MKLLPLFHSVVFSVYPIFYLYSANLGQVRFFDAAVPATVSLFCVAVLLLVTEKLVKDRLKTSLLVSALCFTIFAYGAFDDLLISFSDSVSLRNLIFPIAWFLGFCLGASAIIRTPQSPENAVRFLNAMALVMLLMVSGNIALHHLMPAKPSFSGVSGNESLQVALEDNDRTLPDIYYLILDGYARNDVLYELYQYDNSDFIRFIEDRGFYIASQSYANYPQTYLSLASSLNFAYLNDVSREFYDVNTVEPLIEMINNSRLMTVLKSMGYKSIAFASGYSGTELKTADYYLSRNLLSREFLHTLINTTFFAALRLPFFDFTVSEAEIHRDRIRRTLTSFSSLSLPAAPVFVFAHLICPHPPFVFKHDGQAIDSRDRFHIQDGSHWGSDTAAYKKMYLEQLAYLNTLVKQTVVELASGSGRPRIVVIQSDHGPGSELNWQSVENTNLRERFGILQAIYFSDGNTSGLYPEMSPVNTFRLVLNRLLAQKMPLLEDKSYFAPWFGRYRFVEVTEKLRSFVETVTH